MLAEEYDGIDSFIHRSTRAITGNHWCQEVGGQVPYFDPTPEEREQLGVREFTIDGAIEDRATNVELWETLQAAHEATLAEKMGGKGAKSVKGVKGEKSDKPPTAAEVKAQVEAERRKEGERKERERRTKQALAVNFLRFLIAVRILDQFKTTMDEMLELAVLIAHKGWAAGYSARHVDRALAKIKNAVIADRAGVLIAECFWNSSEKCPATLVGDDDVRYVAEFLAIDVAAAWGNVQMGPLSMAWWNAHGRDDLEQLAQQAGMQKVNAARKCDLVKYLTEAAGVPMPAILGKGKVSRKGAKTQRGERGVSDRKMRDRKIRN